MKKARKWLKSIPSFGTDIIILVVVSVGIFVGGNWWTNGPKGWEEYPFLMFGQNDVAILEMVELPEDPDECDAYLVSWAGKNEFTFSCVSHLGDEQKELHAHGIYIPLKQGLHYEAKCGEISLRFDPDIWDIYIPDPERPNVFIPPD